MSADIRIANDEVEIVVPLGYGPRVTRYARIGGENVFDEIDPAVQGSPTVFGDDWHVYGGHRLWYAPEDAVRSYWPDNQPVRAESTDRAVTLTQAVEGHTGLEKAISVTLDERGSRVQVLHRLSNRGASSLEIAPWALTVMAKGGRAFFPHPPYVPHPLALAPARPLVMWPYTRMSDPRWVWGNRFIMLHHSPTPLEAQKIGFYDAEGWMAYEVAGDLFVKRHEPHPGAHADFGCNVEAFADGNILELETLGPLACLSPGSAIVHRETWFLFGGVDLGGSEDSLEAALAPLLARTIS